MPERAPRHVVTQSRGGNSLSRGANGVGGQSVGDVAERAHAPTRRAHWHVGVDRDGGVGDAAAAADDLFTVRAAQRQHAQAGERPLARDDLVAFQAARFTLWARFALRAGRASGARFTLRARLTSRARLTLWALWTGRAGRASGARFTLRASGALQVLGEIEVAVAVRINLQDSALEAERGGAARFASGARFALRPLGAGRASGAGFTLRALQVLGKLEVPVAVGVNHQHATLELQSGAAPWFTLWARLTGRARFALRPLGAGRASGAGFTLRALQVLGEVNCAVAVGINLQDSALEAQHR